MAARVTDKQKKKIIADYLETESFRATGKRNGVCGDTVKRIVESCDDFKQKSEQKKAENDADVLAYMESKRGLVCDIITLGLNALNNPEKLAEAAPSQITTMIGTLIDKWTMTSAKNGDIEDLTPLADMLSEVAGNE